MLIRADEPNPMPLQAEAAPSGEEEFTGSTTARVRALRRTSDRVLTPLSGALLVLAFTGSFTDAVLGLLAFGSAVLVVPARQRWANLLPLMRSPLHATKPLVGVGILAILEWATNEPGLAAVELAAIGAGTTLAGMAPSILMPQSWAPDRVIRIAVVGPVRVAEELSAELRMEEVAEYTVVGRIASSEDEEPEPHTVPRLGGLSDLAGVVERHDIRLIVFSGEVPRFDLFAEVADKLLDLPVRLWELSGFYEDVFGHVPVAEINASWFQYIMHPRYRAVAPRSKRALDIGVSLVAGLLLLPVLAIAAFLIRRDGGPVLFRQVRIGEGGRPLVMYKLRTMREDDGNGAAQWASADDPRVTPVGRFLRHTHLDEIPQLLNVLRGEMSLVGPRPEQPEFVERLEEFIPFYERRHLLKPGVTGWAQVRCGYAGSDTGSAWKLSHDLYYLKHRSLSFDLAMLGETVRTLFGSRPHRVEPSRFAFVHRPPVEPAPSVSGQ
jgi:exopolysaccharide biosynthesis polyprenyl glycosylphosphotransferase